MPDLTKPAFPRFQRQIEISRQVILLAKLLGRHRRLMSAVQPPHDICVPFSLGRPSSDASSFPQLAPLFWGNIFVGRFLMGLHFQLCMILKVNALPLVWLF